MSIKISTIVPFSNVIEYIEESVETLINQTLGDREVILVDDGATDGSAEIAKRFAQEYDWVKYIQTDHLGPGGARNAGIRIAQGKYMAFADADDLVPADTYEKMYEVAEKNACQVVVGKAVRLYDGDKIRYSDLHEKVFKDYYYATNIRENHQLLYDTTVWNKLIDREYWVSQNILFPEKTPYQDIPATFQMHYNAEKVVMLDKVVYIWRVREGENKSITQQRYDIKNFQARINMLTLVDNYFKEHVNDENLLEAKWYKWLENDLKIFVNECYAVDDETAGEMMRLMKEYIQGNGIEYMLDKLPVLYSEQYKALLAGDLARLRSLRLYEAEEYKALKVKSDKGFFPAAVMKSAANLGTTIDRERLLQKITKLELSAGKVVFNGYMHINYQSVGMFDKPHISAWVVNDAGEKLMTVDNIQRRMTKAASRKNAQGKKVADYTGSGYTISVNSEAVKALGPGRYHILVDWEFRGQKRTTIMAGLKGRELEAIGTGMSCGIDGVKLVATLRKEPEFVVE